MSQKEDELRAEVARLKKDRDFWHDAWFEQRQSTGIAWWEGYRTGVEAVRAVPVPYEFTVSGSTREADPTAPRRRR